MLGILVVAYNSDDVLGDCLESCLRIPGAKILVVDNSPTPNAVVPPGVEIIRNSSNRGFAAAVNQGMTALNTGLVLILNPDVIIQSGVQAMVDACSLPDVAAAGGCLVGPLGEHQPEYEPRQFPTPASLAFETRKLNRLWPGNPVDNVQSGAGSAVESVDQLPGAFMLVKKAAWEQIGGFDESFHPVWFEDVDFCKRLKHHGYSIVRVREAVASHVGGHSANTLNWGCKQVYWYGSLLRYSSKHFSVGSHVAVCVAVALASIPRMFIGIVSHRNLTAVAVYSRVIGLAGTSLSVRRVNNGGMGAPPEMIAGSGLIEKRARQ
jgi:GT2 family glycosyltransferase